LGNNIVAEGDHTGYHYFIEEDIGIVDNVFSCHWGFGIDWDLKDDNDCVGGHIIKKEKDNNYDDIDARMENDRLIQYYDNDWKDNAKNIEYSGNNHC